MLNARNARSFTIRGVMYVLKIIILSELSEVTEWFLTNKRVISTQGGLALIHLQTHSTKKNYFD